MRSYTLLVMGGEAPSYNDPLKFKTDNLEEVIQIIELMLRNGHKVSVLSEGTDPEKPSRELIDAVASELAKRTGEKSPYDFDMDEDGETPVEALAG